MNTKLREREEEGQQEGRYGHGIKGYVYEQTAQ